jgi:hypothetical protein
LGEAQLPAITTDRALTDHAYLELVAAFTTSLCLLAGYLTTMRIVRIDSVGILKEE